MKGELEEADFSDYEDESGEEETVADLDPDTGLKQLRKQQLSDQKMCGRRFLDGECLRSRTGLAGLSVVVPHETEKKRHQGDLGATLVNTVRGADLEQDATGIKEIHLDARRRRNEGNTVLEGGINAFTVHTKIPSRGSTTNNLTPFEISHQAIFERTNGSTKEVGRGCEHPVLRTKKRFQWGMFIGAPSLVSPKYSGGCRRGLLVWLTRARL